jgi:hypothetical protein
MCGALAHVRFGPKADMMAPLHDDWLDWKVLQPKQAPLKTNLSDVRNFTFNLHSVRRDQSYKLFTGNQQPQSQANVDHGGLRFDCRGQ